MCFFYFYFHIYSQYQTQSDTNFGGSCMPEQIAHKITSFHYTYTVAYPAGPKEIKKLTRPDRFHQHEELAQTQSKLASKDQNKPGIFNQWLHPKRQCRNSLLSAKKHVMKYIRCRGTPDLYKWDTRWHGNQFDRPKNQKKRFRPTAVFYFSQ